MNKNENPALKKRRKLRHIAQAVFTAVSNAWIIGFITGNIYTGTLKQICAPGLNCYSCPGALFACPIGSFQAVVGSRKFSVSFFVVGLFFIFGAVFGRFICGFLCPFGFLQDLLNKIPFPKKIKTFCLDKQLRFFKYVVFAVFVLILPMFAVDAAGTGVPAFCKYICPQGTLQAGLPLVIMNGFLFRLVGWIYAWKLIILIVVILFSIIIYRPFCKYLCPLGAVYSLFNKLSLVRIGDKHSDCGMCSMKTKPNGSECIKCFECKKQRINKNSS